MMKKVFKWVAALVILAGLGWYGYQKMQPKNEATFITEEVKRGKIAQTVSATGEIAATNLVDVGAQVSGQIKKMHVKIGDVVKEGDLIAEIDNVTQVNEVNTRKAQLQTYQAQLESAQVALKIAQRKYSRYKSLASADAVSKEEFEATEDSLATNRAKIKELQSSIHQTQIAINTAEKDLGYTRITAPSAGTVVSLVVEQGQTINSSQTSPTVVQIADLTSMTNKMQIAEGDATKVKAGQTVNFTILSEPDTPISAKLDSIDPGLTTMSQGSYSKSTDTTSNAIYYYARATVPNPEGKLAIGMTTQNTVEIASADNVLMVPTVAIKTKDGKKFVRVLEANNQAVDREIQTGLKDSMNTEVKSGLNEGEKVVMSEMGAAEKAEAVEREMAGPPR
ncbi:efflux RND transporter periplasmic adaptor subunit [Kingella oralis]|uniref:Efflux transporter, RND family, MFP subunit n=1 Tax=Kingella oralis ATCC 51147 TaxID=629741 RepID=C4GMX3_9NEIS|nr:efflux RND transporter periplasmic adaptor subunit [Kingella oralis]EEP66658.1 efflux transporter, RND family, MFP subunit [Kingella oralis ATCC 51147]QMT42462.1 efflux RND transporter periplasmic adaptor subunit [Kingella oralis]